MISSRFYALALPFVLSFLTSVPARAQVNSMGNAPSPTSPPPSVYADAFDPKTPPSATAGNTGGANLDLKFSYMTDYVFRGIDNSEVAGKEDDTNLQFESALAFDLGKAPHPYLGVFTNIYNADPISRFQEIRPYFGATWFIRPLEIDIGHYTYIYPERDEQNTSEYFFRFQLDDSFWLKTDKPLFSPYIFNAYDYDKYHGWYIEMGVEHEIPIEDTGLTLRFFSDIAYVIGNERFATSLGGPDTGWQHYDIGMTVSYSLNQAFNLPKQYGVWSIEGYLTYTDGVANELRADTQVWGGAGLHFQY